MPTEGATNISELDPAQPAADGPAGEGDDHLRMVKLALRASFPALDGLISNGVADASPGNVDPPDAATWSALFTNVDKAVQGLPAWGRVGLDGNSAATPGTNDWTSSRIGLGHYRLIFNKAASATENQSLVAMVGQQDSGVHNRSITQLCINTTTVDVFIYNTILSDKVDDDFNFVRYA